MVGWRQLGGLRRVWEFGGDPLEEKSIGVPFPRHFLGISPQFGMTHTDLGKVMEML
jgi:hypothetical protein